jgi:hypothetical protein
MTTRPEDEDTLIQAARAERRQHRSGASMFAMLGVAVAFGVAGCLLMLVPHLVTILLPGPFRIIGGFSMSVFITVGIVALGIAGFFLLAAFASSPLASWGNKLPGDCPSCGQPRLRSDTVPGGTSGTASDAPRGIVTLCETPKCNYAAVRVTRASSAASTE